MLAVFLALTQAFQNLLVRGRGLILHAARIVCRPAQARDRRTEDLPEVVLRGLPCAGFLLASSLLLFLRSIRGDAQLARAKDVLGGRGVQVQAVPAFARGGLILLAQQQLLFVLRNNREDSLELSGLDPRRQRAPAVTLPEQHNEVGLDAGLLAALNLAQADLQGLLVERRLVAHAPAQVDGLEARVVRLAELAQPGEDVALQRVALGLQVFKGRADKYPECACCGRHQSISNELAALAPGPATSRRRWTRGSFKGKLRRHLAQRGEDLLLAAPHRLSSSL